MFTSKHYIPEINVPYLVMLSSLNFRVYSAEYKVLGKKGEGTFSEVLKCQNIKDGSFAACKKMKQHYDR